jgi:2,5-dioxopentanoate dehydrogenase
MELHGKNIVAGVAAAGSGKTFHTVNPATGERLEPGFFEASPEECDHAVESATAAYAVYRKKSAAQIADFLDRIAAEIDALGDAMIQRAHLETALPQARLTGERGRTTGQLKAFADVVRDGSWLDARIDRALPDRKPLPRPDIRRMLVPMGPVLVFGASNFPLAFSAAGGDTASALAAGNPVVIKTHPAHPGTSEMVMRAILKAIDACGMPAGVVSMIHSTGSELATRLVKHPAIRAVGFTGSLKAGRAIFNAAAARPEPIPVYAEMGSINPVFILPGALAERGNAIAQGLVQSVTLGVGQFCTNPGIVFGPKGQPFNAFIKEVATHIAGVAPGTMLYPGIRDRFQDGADRVAKTPGVKMMARSSAVSDPKKTHAGAMMFHTDTKTFERETHLREELFGPSTLLVECDSIADAERAAALLEGQLTATVHGTDADLAEYHTLIDLLSQKVGRILYNGFPTGVEVCPAMVHGGPYPATTDPRSTSVGTGAILRFARPVCYQNFPQELLPTELKNRNERGIWRRIDGEFTKEDA